MFYIPGLKKSAQGSMVSAWCKINLDMMCQQVFVQGIFRSLMGYSYWLVIRMSPSNAFLTKGAMVHRSEERYRFVSRQLIA